MTTLGITTALVAIATFLTVTFDPSWSQLRDAPDHPVTITATDKAEASPVTLTTELTP